MSNLKSFGDSLLSALLIISWFAIIIKVFILYDNGNFASKFFWTLLTVFSTSIIGGVSLHFYILLKRTLKRNFVYNFFGTLNIILGFLGMVVQPATSQHIPYLAATCFAISIIIY